MRSLRFAPCFGQLLTAALLCVMFLLPGQTRESWSQESWGGFQNGGRPLAEGAELPVRWSPQSGVAWERRLEGYGQSSPVAYRNTIFVTSTAGAKKDRLFVEAFRAEDGKREWVYTLDNSSPEMSSNYISRAAPTPVCDKDGVIAFFEGGNIVALTADGKLRWQRDFVAEFGPIKARHGLGASLEQDAERVYVWIERAEDPYLAAIRKSDGQTIWKVPGLGVTSWSSPRLVPVDNAAHLVISGIGKIVGIDPRTGDRLWSFAGLDGNSTATPMPVGKGRFLIAASEGRGEAGGGNTPASNGLMAIRKSADDKYRAGFVWQADKATSSFGSPIAFQGYAYFVNRVGVVYCLDLESGKQRYAKRTSSSVWATPLAVNDHIYLFGRDGVTTVLRAGPAYEESASNALWKSGSETNGGFGGPTLYAAAVAKGRLLLRRGDMLYAVGAKNEADASR